MKGLNNMILDLVIDYLYIEIKSKKQEQEITLYTCIRKQKNRKWNDKKK
jgi:hypothetical protein